MYIIMEYIYLNSVNSTFSDITKYHTFFLTKPIIAHDRKINIKLQDAEIPISYYNIITGYNDTFSFKITNTSDLEKTYSFAFPQKNYTSKQLITYINSQITTNGAVANGITTSMSFDEQSLKFTINCSADTAIVKKIEITNTLATRIMGFTNGDKTAESAVNTLTLTAPNASNLNRTKNIYFFVKSFNTNNSNSDLNEGNDILAKVQAGVRFNDIISYQNSSDLFINIPEHISYIDRLELKLLDDDFEFLDFNRLNFCLSLCIQYTDKQNVVFESDERTQDAQLLLLEEQLCENI
jgi:hypothetical protein